MRFFFRRSIIWLLPVILVPLAVLLTTQYRLLRTLEKTTASAERNVLRGALEKITQDVEWYYRTSATRALSMPLIALSDPLAAGEHVRRNNVGGAKTFFTVAFCEPMATSYFGPDGREKWLGRDELEAIKMAYVSWYTAYKLDSVVPKPELHVDERNPRNRVIVRPMTDSAMHVIGVAGVVLDEKLARQSIFSIASTIARQQKHGNDLALRIGEKFPKMPGGRDFLTQPFGFVFTNWRVGIRDACASPEQLAAIHFRSSMMWTGCVAFVLLGAIVLAIQATARQMRLSQMKSDFVSNVSHELRTPLSSIRVFGEYMRLGRVNKPEKIREYGEYIEAESRRLTALINNILDFSKIESAEKKYRFGECDLADAVATTVSAFEMPLREHGFTVTYRRPAEPMPTVFDKDALAQAVVNLLDNAVKYSGDRREIEVRLEADGTDARISVRDHGIGIAACEQKKIFEKFYRVGSGLVHDVKGSGLGLAIVSHIVQAHGGRVDVASTPGEGSLFTIVLPMTRAEAVPMTNTTTTEFA